MKEKLRAKPELLKQKDIVSFYHIQIPRWLFADKRYNHISLAAKVAYSLLLNRHQLSKLNGWINEAGEVYIIFPREELAAELQVGARKAISVFKELAGAGLVWEERRGNNKANLIYLARVELSQEDGAAYSSPPFHNTKAAKDPADAGSTDDEGAADFGSAGFACPKEAKSPANSVSVQADAESGQPATHPGHAKNALPEVRNPVSRTGEKRMSGHAENAGPDMPNSHPSNTYVSQNKISHTDKSQSVCLNYPDDNRARRTQEELAELEDILDTCCLDGFDPKTAQVLSYAVERLYFSQSFQVGNCVLPQETVRSRLRTLDYFMLQTAENKIRKNTTQKIRNTTAYTMAVVFNAIGECESDLLHDPFLNTIRAAPQNCRQTEWGEP